MAPPIRVAVYDKAFNFRGTIGNPGYVTLTLTFMAPGLGQFSIPNDHHRLGDLMTPGARVHFTDAKGDHLLAGSVRRWRGTGPERSGSVEFDVIGDFSILQTTLGWVVPGAAITEQGTAGTNWTMTGPAETVLKAAVTENAVNRLGLPITVPTTLGRGSTVSARLRFQTLHERLILTEDGAGIIDSGIAADIVPTEGGLLLDVWTPKTVLQPINERSGIVKSWSYAYDHAKITRVVVAGQGEGTLRLFRERVDAATEAELGEKREAFRDARDSDDPTVLYARADETITENAARSGLSVEFGEAGNFQYGRHFKVGDRVTLEVGGVSISDRLTECTLSWTKDGGFEARPRVGARSEDPSRTLANAVMRIARGIRNRNAEA